MEVTVLVWSGCLLATHALALVLVLWRIGTELRRIRQHLQAQAQGRVRSQAPGDGGTGDRLMGDLRRFQGARFSVPMRAGGGRPDAAATR